MHYFTTKCAPDLDILYFCDKFNLIKMKKALFTFLILSLSVIVTAQEKKQTEFEVKPGDTIVWQPFENCDTLNYGIKGHQYISFKPINTGYCIQIVAEHVGKSTITATCRCNDSVSSAIIKIKEEVVEPITSVPVKPQTQSFTGVYGFYPPTNYFFVSVTNPEQNCRETYVKIGDIEAFNDGQGFDRFWNVKTGKNWYYRPDAQGWTDDVDWEFEPLGKSFFPLNSFADEVKKDNLPQYYVGMEKVLTVNCWHFFVDHEDGSVIQYWVDPVNGCTLKRQVNNEKPREVAVYDLNYRKLHFGPSFKKGLHDTRR